MLPLSTSVYPLSIKTFKCIKCTQYKSVYLALKIYPGSKSDNQKKVQIIRQNVEQ